MADIGEEHVIIPCLNQYGNMHFASNSGAKMCVGDEIAVFTGPDGQKYGLKPCPVFQKGKPVATFINGHIEYWSYGGDDIIVIPSSGVGKNQMNIAVADIPNYGLMNGGVAGFDFDATTEDWSANQGGSMRYDKTNSTIYVNCSSEIITYYEYNPYTGRNDLRRYRPMIGYIVGYFWLDTYSPVSGMVMDAEWSGLPSNMYGTGKIGASALIGYGLNLGNYGTRYSAGNPPQPHTGWWGDTNINWDGGWSGNSMHRVLTTKNYGIMPGAAIGGVAPAWMGIDSPVQKKIMAFRLHVDAEFYGPMPTQGGSGHSVWLRIHIKTFR